MCVLLFCFPTYGRPATLNQSTPASIGLPHNYVLLLCPTIQGCTDSSTQAWTTSDGGTTSLEYTAVKATGFKPVIVTTYTWKTMVSYYNNTGNNDFSFYVAIVLGDPGCSTTDDMTDAEASSSIWGKAVAGNIEVVGTSTANTSGTPSSLRTIHQNLVQDGINFVTNGGNSSGPGLYLDLSCYFNSSPVSSLSVMNYFGTFDVVGSTDNAVHMIGESPALTQNSDRSLSGWGPSVEESFTNWPKSTFVPAAIDENNNTAGYSAPDGSRGDPYILTSNYYVVPNGGPFSESESYGGRNGSEACLACQDSSSAVPSTKDPVNSATGDYSSESTLLSVPGAGPDLSFSTSYDAQMAQAQLTSGADAGPLGYGRTYNWDMYLTEDPTTNDVTITQGTGSQVSFVPTSGDSNVWCVSTYNYCPTSPRVTASLNLNSDSSWTFIRQLSGAYSYIFTSSGLLSAETDPAGDQITITTQGGAIGCNPVSANTSCTIEDVASSQSITLNFATSGTPSNQPVQLISVTDSDNNGPHFCFYQQSCASGAPANSGHLDDLYSVTNYQGGSPTSDVTTYTYDYSNANPDMVDDLLTVTGPNGQPGQPQAGTYLSNTYDSSGRIVIQTEPDGSTSQFVYNGDPQSVAGGATDVISYPNGIIQSGISCISSTTCYMVSGSTVIMTTNSGTTWTDGNISGIYNLAGISCPTSTVCYGVGSSDTAGMGAIATLSSGSWTVTDAPSGVGELYGITCTSSTYCIAVGSSTANGQAVIVTDNNGSLTSTSAPIGVSSLSNVSCVSSSDCYAVGQSFTPGIAAVIYFNGSVWSGITIPAGVVQLNSINCNGTSTSAICIGVGLTDTPLSSTNTTSGAVISATESNGTWSAWSLNSSLPQYVYDLTGVNCLSLSNCYAVGYTNALNASIISSTNANSSSPTWVNDTVPVMLPWLSDINCLSSSDCFAVGSSLSDITLLSSTSATIFSAQSPPTGVTGYQSDASMFLFSSGVDVSETFGYMSGSQYGTAYERDPNGLLSTTSFSGPDSTNSSTYEDTNNIISNDQTQSISQNGATTDTSYITTPGSPAINQPYCTVSPDEVVAGYSCPSSPLTAPPPPNTDPDFGVTLYAYDSYGNQIATVDPLGNTSVTQYTENIPGVPNNLAYCTIDAKSYALGATCPPYGYYAPGTVDKTFNSNGYVTGSVSATGATTTYTYSSVFPGKIATETAPDGTVTSFTYNSLGETTLTTKEFDPSGWSTPYISTTQDAYDAAGQQYCSVTPLNYESSVRCPTSPPAYGTQVVGATMTYYDANGNVTETVNPLGGISVNAYDMNGRMFCSVDSANYANGVRCPGQPPSLAPLPGIEDLYLGATITTYNSSGQAIQTTSPLGLVTLSTYDTSGNVIATQTETGDKNDPGTITYNLYNLSGQQVATCTVGNGDAGDYPGFCKSDTAVGNTDTFQQSFYDPSGNVYCTLTQREIDAGGDPCRCVYRAVAQINRLGPHADVRIFPG